MEWDKAECVSSVHFGSVAQSCPTLCDPMNYSMPGLPVHHHLPESTQTHVHLVGDATQTSHPLLSPSSLALDLSQHQGLFQWVKLFASGGQKIEVSASHQSFQWNPGLISFRMDWLDLLAVQDSQESSPTPQFKSINSSVLSFPYSPTLIFTHDHLKNHSLD